MDFIMRELTYTVPELKGKIKKLAIFVLIAMLKTIGLFVK